jgi:hypothetical protein
VGDPFILALAIKALHPGEPSVLSKQLAGPPQVAWSQRGCPGAGQLAPALGVGKGTLSRQASEALCIWQTAGFLVWLQH